ANPLRSAVFTCGYLPTHTNTWDNSSPTCGFAVCRRPGLIGDRIGGQQRCNHKDTETQRKPALNGPAGNSANAQLRSGTGSNSSSARAVMSAVTSTGRANVR